MYEGKSAKDIRTEYRNRRHEIETEIGHLHRIAKRLEYYEEQIERIWLQQDGKSWTATAKAVILATGGFGANRHMVAH